MASPPLSLYAPLWGAEFDSEDCGLVGGHVMACRPHEEEWRSIQRTRVADLRAGYGGVVPLCLTVLVPRADGEDLERGITRVGSSMVLELREAVLALRLHGGGWFLDPEMAETTFAIAEAGWELRRSPGPYRQAFLAGVSDTPLSPYRLALADLTTSRERSGPIATSWTLVRAYHMTPGNPSVEIAIEGFRRSFGFQLSAAEDVSSASAQRSTRCSEVCARRVSAT